MTRQTMHRILELQDQVWKEPEFQALCQEHALRSDLFLRAMQDMPSAQQAAVFDYIGLLIELQNKMLEYALRHADP